jgi:TIR domain
MAAPCSSPRVYTAYGFFVLIKKGSGKSYVPMPFHVFLSHSSADKPAVEDLARQLAEEGVHAWLDKWHLIPGNPWQPDIEKALAESETCAVFIGHSG